MTNKLDRSNSQLIYFVSLVGVMLLFLLSACAGGNSDPNPNIPIADHYTDKFQQKPLHDDQFLQNGTGAKARMLFVVDNSISMNQEQDKIGTAAPTIVSTIATALPNVNLGFAAITTNTFGSNDITYNGTNHYNPLATTEEIERELFCFDPTDLNSLYYTASLGNNEYGTYCAYNWRVNGTQGKLRQVAVPHDSQSYPEPNGPTVLTGRESNFSELITALLKVGVGGHWLESGAMALMQFIHQSGADYDKIRDPNAHLAIINLTDFGDASHRHNEGTKLDSRDPNGPMDFNNPLWYTDLSTNFLTELQNLKASPTLLSYHVIGPEAATVGCAPENGFNSRLKDIALLMGGITDDICQLNSFDTILTNIANNVTAQLDKQFNLSYSGEETILKNSIAVTVDGANVAAFTYIAPALILFDQGYIPPIGSDVHATYLAPKIAGYQLTELPIESSIVINIINSDGSKTPMSSDTWDYNATTNSIDFVDTATAPQAAVKFEVNYRPLRGQV